MEGQPQHEAQTHEQQQGQEQQRFKTLGVRIEEGLHARLSFIAQLTESTIADEIRRAIEARIQAAQEDPELVARAEAVQGEIEREAEARRQAIAGFFGQVALGSSVEQTEGRRGRGTRGKSAGPAAAPEQA